MRASKARALLAFSCGAAIALLFSFACIVSASDGASSVSITDSEDAPLFVTDTRLAPIPSGTYMPLYLQDDAQWSYIEYAGGTIADSGCGLTCAAMAIKYLTTQDVTPLSLAESVGDECLTDGVNDPAKFAAWIRTAYPDYNIEVASTMWTLDEALADVDGGWVCFAGLSGVFGDSSYDGHVVLIWRSYDGGYLVRDPASAANSARAFSVEELEAVDFRYFVCLRGGHYDYAGD